MPEELGHGDFFSRSPSPRCEVRLQSMTLWESPRHSWTSFTLANFLQQPKALLYSALLSHVLLTGLSSVFPPSQGHPLAPAWPLHRDRALKLLVIPLPPPRAGAIRGLGPQLYWAIPLQEWCLDQEPIPLPTVSFLLKRVDTLVPTVKSPSFNPQDHWPAEDTGCIHHAHGGPTSPSV